MVAPGMDRVVLVEDDDLVDERYSESVRPHEHVEECWEIPSEDTTEGVYMTMRDINE